MMVRRFALGHYHTGRNVATIDLGGLEIGLYCLRLVSDFGSTMTKVVVAPQP
jgi:hypothetical protein